MPPRKQMFLWLAVVVLIVGAGLRFFRIDAQSLWNDEGSSARIAERPVGDIIAGAGGDIHPPGYYLTLAGWRALTGPSELALRTLSALAGLVAVALIYRLGRHIFGLWEGLAGALLVMLSPFHIYYAQEARMYAPLAALSAASLLLTALVLGIPAQMVAGRFQPRRAALILGAYVLVNMMGLYTHYSFPLVIAAETLVFIIWLMGRSRKGHGLAVWGLLQGLTLLAFLPWLPVAVRQISTWPRGGEPGAVNAFLAGAVYGPTLPEQSAYIGLIPLLLVAGVGLFPPIDEDEYRRAGLNWPERIGLGALPALALPLTLILIGGTSEPYIKFALAANLSLLLLAGRGISIGLLLARPSEAPQAAGGPWMLALVLFLIGCGLYPMGEGLGRLYTDPAYARDDYRGMAQTIRAEAGDQAAVILTAPNQWEVFTYYYPDGPLIAPLPRGGVDTGGEVGRLLGASERVYALFWGAEQQDPGRSVETALQAGAFPLREEWRGGVRFVTYLPLPAEGAQQVPSGAAFGESITLESYALTGTTLNPGEALGISLWWRTSAPIAERLKVFVHLYAPDGALIAQHDAEPALNLRPATSWAPGEVIRDNHGLLPPADLPPGEYRLAVGLYTLQGVRLPVGGEDALTLGQVRAGP